jgi:hypothetical protein
MPEFLFSNFGQSTLSAPCYADEQMLLVSPSDTQRFPVPGADQVFTLILTDGRGEPEIVWVTSNPKTGALTVLRGQEGTPAQGWATGTQVLHSHTAASLEWFVTGGQIVWKNQFQAALDALQAQLNAIVAREDTQDTNWFTYQNYVESKFEQSFATISEVHQVVTDFNYAMSQITQTLTADVSSNHAELVEFKQTTAGSFGAQAVYNLDLTARTNLAEANASLALQTSIDNDNALSTLTTTVGANWNANGAQITSLQQADVSNYAALASSIATVAANYGPLSATVTVKAIALADLTGAVGGSFMVDINADGNFAGFEIVAGTQAGLRVNYAKFTVDKFIIDSPSGSIHPFLYDAVTGTLYLQNLRIYGNLVVDGTIDTAQLAPQAVTYVNIAYNDITGTEYTPAAGGPIPHTPAQVAEHFVTTIGGIVMVEVGLRVVGSGGSIGHRFTVYRDGPDGTGIVVGDLGVYSLGGQPHNYAFKRFRDTPTPGGQHYYVTGFQESGGGTYNVVEGYIMTEDQKTSL